MHTGVRVANGRGVHTLNSRILRCVTERGRNFRQCQSISLVALEEHLQFVGAAVFKPSTTPEGSLKILDRLIAQYLDAAKA